MVEIKNNSKRTKIIVIVSIVVMLLCCWGTLALTAYRTNPATVAQPTYSISDSQTKRAVAVPTYRTMRPTDIPSPEPIEGEGTPELPEGTNPITTTATITATAVATDTNNLTTLLNTVLVPSNRDVARITNANIVSGTVISITWTINDNLTDAIVAEGAKFDIYSMLAALSETETELQLVNLIGTYPQLDEAGNLVETTVVNVTYSPEIITQTDWATFNYEAIYTIATILEIHPAFGDG